MGQVGGGAVAHVVEPFPATWLLMLFLGSAGLNISYGGVLPLGILESARLGGATAQPFD